jgi:NAD(P)-dependent dehydrogenase (short-subunit alcohol dehydrogenase family)
VKLAAGQVAVITGGASGIGLALAERLAQRGLQLVLADVDDEALDNAAAKLSESTQVATAHTDVTDSTQVESLAALTLDRFGHVDVVCNNAGVVGNSLPLWEYELVDWEWLLGVDLWGVIHGIRTFVPLLVAQGHGHVVNTASMAGLTVVPLNGPYNASKHAVVSMSETLWADQQQRAPDVGVTVLCPGPTYTRMMTEGGDRTRPAHLQPSKEGGVPPQLNPGTFAAAVNTMFSADEMAKATLQAVERGQLYLAPHPTAADRIRSRSDRILGDVSSLTMAPSVHITSAEALRK